MGTERRSTVKKTPPEFLVASRARYAQGFLVTSRPEVSLQEVAVDTALPCRRDAGVPLLPHCILLYKTGAGEETEKPCHQEPAILNPWKNPEEFYKGKLLTVII